MKTKEIKLNGKKFMASSPTRAWLMYESITGKVYGKIDNLTDTLNFVFCLIKSNKDNEFELTFDEFLDEIDKDPKFIESITGSSEGK